MIVQSLRINAKAAEQAHGLSGAQVFVLQKLAESAPMSVNGLAARTLTHQSSVSGVLAKLCEKEFVKKQPDPLDARKTILYLTPKGKKLLKTSKPSVQVQLIEALKKMKKSELHSLARLLTKAVSLAGIYEEVAPLFLEEPSR